MIPSRQLFELAALLLAVVSPAAAQLLDPNAAGVRIGHLHLAVTDVEAQTRFWTQGMDGRVVRNGPLTLIELPGVFIMLRKVEAALLPPEGSVVNHFGFVFKNLPVMLERWKAAGYRIEQTDNPSQGYVHAPDGVRIEFFGEPLLPVAMQLDHVHSYVVAKDIPAIQAWYAKLLGGEPGLRVRVSRPGWIDAVHLPGMNWSFSATDMPLAATKGRSLDHVGIDVADLDAFAAHLAALGLTFDAPPRAIPNTKTRVAFLSDPWGTYIEVTEHLAP